MRCLYNLALNIAIPFAIVGLCLRGFKNRGYWHRWPERFGFANHSVRQNASFDLWVHAVSVGEARAAATLIDALVRQDAKLKIIVTTTTPTGSAMAREMLGQRVTHCYFPYDLRWAMRRFVKILSVKTVVVMETEIWPNMIAAVSDSGARIIYLNVRMSQRSFDRYRRFKSWVQNVLERVDHFAVQGRQDQRYLQMLGVPSNKMSITGSIKFDVEVHADLLERAQQLKQQFGKSRLIWIAGSTRDNEEQTVISAYMTLKQRYTDLLLVLVPRHPERFESVARLVERNNLNLSRRSAHADGAMISSEVDVYLGDTMGELILLYATADVAFVGGSLAPLGGQNILEACAVGVPVLFGPHMFNFPDVSRWAVEANAGLMVADNTQLVSNLASLLADEKRREKMGANGLAFVNQHKGALEKTLGLLIRHAV